MLSKVIKNKGFTLIEVMVVIVVVSVGIVGVANLTLHLISRGHFVVSKFIAAGLLQEGIEIIRALRDTNWVSGAANWDLGLVAGDYEADWNDQALVSYQDRFLRNSGGLYSYDAGAQTRFKRRITIQRPQSHIIQASVLVSWSEAGKTYTISAVENLYEYWQ